MVSRNFAQQPFVLKRPASMWNVYNSTIVPEKGCYYRNVKTIKIIAEYWFFWWWMNNRFNLYNNMMWDVDRIRTKHIIFCSTLEHWFEKWSRLSLVVIDQVGRMGGKESGGGGHTVANETKICEVNERKWPRNQTSGWFTFHLRSLLEGYFAFLILATWKLAFDIYLSVKTLNYIKNMFLCPHSTILKIKIRDHDCRYSYLQVIYHICEITVYLMCTKYQIRQNSLFTVYVYRNG